MIVLSRGKIAEKHAYYAVNTNVLVDISALLAATKEKTVSHILFRKKGEQFCQNMGNLLLFSYHSSAMPQGQDRCRFDTDEHGWPPS